MSKFDNSVVDNLKILSLDMINEAGSGDVSLTLNSAALFYSLMLRHLNFNPEDNNWLNRDRLIVSNPFLPLFYSVMHLFTKEISMDNLKDFKKLDSLCKGNASNKTPGINIGSLNSSDVISTSAGIALGERYLESLVKIEVPKCELVNFHTFCVCLESDLMSGEALETLSYVGKENLNKMIYIVIRNKEAKDEAMEEVAHQKLSLLYEELNYNVEELNITNQSAIDGAIEDAKISKKPTILFLKLNNKDEIEVKYNKPLKEEEFTKLKEELKINTTFEVPEEIYSEIRKLIDKKMEKVLTKWQEVKEESLKDLKLKKIINFLEKKTLNINFVPDNIKINDNYEEELSISNMKIFNLFASKSPFILSLSNDNFINTKMKITKSGFMHKDSPTERNINLGNRPLALGGIASGLASLGFKVIVSAPLITASNLLPFLKLGAYNNLDINYFFTQDSFLNTYEDNGNASVIELNTLRMVPNLITIRPADINEVIGTYDILANTRKPLAVVIGDEIVKKEIGTNYKYVMAGAYRVRKELERLDAIIIASGEEVKTALKVAEDLKNYGLDLRVVTMPSQELFNIQTDRYQNMLLPKEVKTFTLEFGSSLSWYRYASGKDYIIGLDTYTESGTKQELLSRYNLDLDAIKTRIVEILKNN